MCCGSTRSCKHLGKSGPGCGNTGTAQRCMRAGEIVAWFPQVRITLAAGIVYVADFLVILSDGTWRAEDVKSVATRKIRTYRDRRRLFRDKFGRDIVEVG